MLLTRVRVNPCRERLTLSSSGRSTTSTCPSWRTVISPATWWLSAPRGPVTVTERPSSATLTPEGTGTGVRPIRDIRHSSTNPRSSPDVAEDLATDSAFAGLPVAHEALAGRQYGNAQAAKDARQLVGPSVDTKPWLGNAPDSRDGPGAVGRILHGHFQETSWPLFVARHLEARYVALADQDRSECFLELRRRHAHRVMMRDVGIAQPGQHVSDRVSHSHVPLPPTSSTS